MTNLTKIICTPLLIAGGIGTMIGFGGLVVPAIIDIPQDIRLQRLEDDRRFLLSNETHQKYVEISNEIERLKMESENSKRYCLYSLGIMAVSSIIGLSAGKILDYSDRNGDSR